MAGDTLLTDVLGSESVGMRSILVDVEPNPANARAEAIVHPTYRVSHLLDIPDLLGLE